MGQDANQQQTQPKYDTAGPEANPGHIDEDSHHCDISALQELPTILNKYLVRKTSGLGTE